MKHLFLLFLFVTAHFFKLAAQEVVFDNCETNTGWGGSQSVTVDNSDKKEGVASLKSEGAGTERFKRGNVSPAINTGITNLSTGYLRFWFYISDASQIDQTYNGSIEISSSGAPDQQEYNWNFRSQNFKNGWNDVILSLTSAGTTGGTPNLSAINFIRVYQRMTSSVVTKIDQIRFLNGHVPTPTPNAVMLNKCETTEGWDSGNTIIVDNNNYINGYAGLSLTGSDQNWFTYNAVSPKNSLLTEDKGLIKFWLYTSNAAAHAAGGKIFMSSSGQSTQDAYSWNIEDLKLLNGWNHIILRLSEASKAGTPNLNQVNYFKVQQPVTSVITAKIDEIEFFNPPAADNATLENKVMFGYQGWFSTPNDGQGVNSMTHWFRGTPLTQVAENATFDMWPDMREYPDAGVGATDMFYKDRSVAKLFSSYSYSTVDAHMRWIQENGLDGVFQQRFLSTIRNPQLVQRFDKVIQNVEAASEKYERVYCIMYDLSGFDENTIADVKNDWIRLVDVIKVTESEAYLKHKGKPLVAFYGLGFEKNVSTPAMVTELVDWFKNTAPEQYRASVMGGLNDSWRTQSIEWQDAYKTLDVISPWSVGRYNNSTGADNFYNSKILPETQYCAQNNIDYFPVIWPGFSWFNLQKGSETTNQKNQIPRNGGAFYWRQSYNAIRAGAKMVYIAMFDEVDEATSMFKVAKFNEQVPENNWFLTLAADGYDLSTDWYLTLADYTKKALTAQSDNQFFLPLKTNLISTDQATLPVTIVNFSVSGENSRVKIDWTTSSEMNSDRFVIQRSGDDENFSTLQTVFSKGNSNGINSYHVFDENPLTGNNYYRLLQYDKDGKMNDYGVKVVNFSLSAKTSLAVYPNPSSGDFNVKVNSPTAGSIKMNLTDLSGRTIKSVTLKNSEGQQDFYFKTAKDTVPGVYILEVVGENFNEKTKVIIK